MQGTGQYQQGEEIATGGGKLSRGAKASSLGLGFFLLDLMFIKVCIKAVIKTVSSKVMQSNHLYSPSAISVILHPRGSLYFYLDIDSLNSSFMKCLLLGDKMVTQPLRTKFSFREELLGVGGGE